MVALKTMAHEVSDGLQIYKKNWPSCAGNQFNQTKYGESNEMKELVRPTGACEEQPEQWADLGRNLYCAETEVRGRLRHVHA